MKFLLILFLVTVSFTQVFAQTKTYTATVYRHQTDSFYIVSARQDSMLVTRKVATEVGLDEGYRFVMGEGRKKDASGIREKFKRYLINQEGDTLMTLLPGSREFRLYDGSYLKKKTTDEGWQFTNEHEDIVSEVNLLWNDNKWMFTITNALEGKKSHILGHYIFSYMVGWAIHRSDTDDYSDDGDGDFWWLLWLTSTLSGEA